MFNVVDVAFGCLGGPVAFLYEVFIDGQLEVVLV